MQGFPDSVIPNAESHVYRVDVLVSSACLKYMTERLAEKNEVYMHLVIKILKKCGYALNRLVLNLCEKA